MASGYLDQPSQSSSFNWYDNTDSAINDCLKQFNDLTTALNDVCNLANNLGRSLEALEYMTIPEIISGEQVKKTPTPKFKHGAALSDSLDTFSKIMMTYSEKIKNDAIDNFDNFIMQSVMPNEDEIEGIQEHNSQIIHEVRESFFSMYNHFIVLAAELMEKFLLCNNCWTPIGFPHKPLCLTDALATQNVWKKKNFDDKFITFGMGFCFDELLTPSCRKNFLGLLENCCNKQNKIGFHSKVSLPLVTNSWPQRWSRDEKSKKLEKPKLARPRPILGVVHPPVFHPSSIWAPTKSETVHLTAPTSYKVPEFMHHQDTFDPFN